MRPRPQCSATARSSSAQIARLLLLLTIAARTPGVAATEFLLRNDLDRTARFDFVQSTSWWRGEDLVASAWVQPDLSERVRLPELPSVSFRYTTLDNTRSEVVVLPPSDLRPSGDGSPARVTFKGIVQKYRSEERTRTYTVTTMVPETKTRMVNVTKYRSEERVRRVRERDPGTGRLVWRDQKYTVLVPYTEQQEQTYTTSVPVSAEKTMTYTVQVPVTEALLDIDGRPVSVAVITTEGGDGQRRILGVTLADVQGVVVRSVAPGSPATRMKEFGPKADLSKRHALEPNVDRIVRINGQVVSTVQQAVAEVQKSPATCFLTVASRGRETTFEVDLDLVENGPTENGPK